MSDLDFLNFKEFPVGTRMALNVRGSGGWEVELCQSGEGVVLTLDQLERIARRCSEYVNKPEEER